LKAARCKLFQNGFSPASFFFKDVEMSAITDLLGNVFAENIEFFTTAHLYLNNITV